MSEVVGLNRTWQGATKQFVFEWRDDYGTAFSFTIEAHNEEHARNMLSPDCVVRGKVCVEEPA